MEVLPELVAIVRLDSRELTYLNQAGHRLLGLPAGTEIAGLNWLKFCPAWLPGASEGRLCSFTGREIQVELREVVQDRSVCIVARQIRDEQRFKLALRNSDISVFEQDRDLRYTWAHNDHPLFQPEVLVGKTDREANPGPWWDHIIAIKQRIIETGKGERHQFVIPVGGEPFTYDMTLEPLLNEAGEVVGLGGSAVDITELKKLESELRVSEEKHRLLTNALRQIIWVADAAGNTEYLNEYWSEYTGLPRSASTDAGSAAVVHPDDMSRVARDWEAARRAAEPVDIEYRLRRNSDGAYRWHLARQFPVKAPDGSVLQWIGVGVDIHDLREAEMQIRQLNTDLESKLAEMSKTERALRQANAALEQFAYAAAHDLQEPIRTVALYSQLVTRRYSGSLNEEGLGFLQHVTAGAKRMQRLIDDLLSYTRATHDDASEQSIASGQESFSRAVDNLKGSIEQAGARVWCGELPRVGMREGHLVQVLQNLLSNALKYRRPGVAPEVEVAAEVEGQQCTFAVKDNGQGIPPEHYERIFRVFNRLHGTDIPGTGIGLSICERIVSHYGGRIWVDSIPGSGTTFYFTVPIA